MKIYTVSALVTISILTEVIAESEEQALEIAEERPMQSFCNSCSSKDPDDQWVFGGELDGTACDLTIVK